MTDTENSQPGLRDPYLAFAHVVQRSAYVAAANAGISRGLNGLLFAAALSCGGYGLYTGDKHIARIGGGLALTHLVNERFSRRREKQFEALEQAATAKIAFCPVHPDAERFEKPNRIDLTPREYTKVGRLASASFCERSLKYANFTMDCAALGYMAFAAVQPLAGITLLTLGALSARRGFGHFQQSRKPLEELGIAETRSFMKAGRELLTYRLPAGSPQRP